MSEWPSTKAKQVFAALLRNGWKLKRQTGSHKVLWHPDHADFIFAFHDNDEIGPHMLARISRHTGLAPHDLR